MPVKNVVLFFLLPRSPKAPLSLIPPSSPPPEVLLATTSSSSSPMRPTYHTRFLALDKCLSSNPPSRLRPLPLAPPTVLIVILCPKSDLQPLLFRYRPKPTTSPLPNTLPNPLMMILTLDQKGHSRLSTQLTCSWFCTEMTGTEKAMRYAKRSDKYCYGNILGDETDEAESHPEERYGERCRDAEMERCRDREMERRRYAMPNKKNMAIERNKNY